MKKLSNLIVTKQIKGTSEIEAYMAENGITFKEARTRGLLEEFVEEIREAYRRAFTEKTSTEEAVFEVLNRFSVQEGAEVVEEAEASVAEQTTNAEVDSNAKATASQDEVKEESGVAVATEVEIEQPSLFEEEEVKPEKAATVTVKEATGSAKGVVIEGDLSEEELILELTKHFAAELEGAEITTAKFAEFEQHMAVNNILYRKGKTQEDLVGFLERTAKKKKSTEEKIEMLSVHFGRTLRQSKKKQ